MQNDDGLVERIARQVWEQIASTSPNPKYYYPWDKMAKTHPAKVHHMATASATVAALRAELAAERAAVVGWKDGANKALRIIRDRDYMLAAVIKMLGPKGQQVIASWNAKHVQRVHYSWGPEGEALHGEEAAEVMLQWEEAARSAVEIGNIDEDFHETTKQREVSEWIADLIERGDHVKEDGNVG